MTPRPFRLRRTRRDTRDTVTVWLEPLDGGPLRFEPGQFTMLGAPGHAEVPISISGDADRPELLQHTVRRVGDATAALVRACRGDTLLVRGPFGRGWSVADGAGGDLILLAGGIGLAPLRPALLAVLARRARYRRVLLLYGSRSPADLLFTRDLERWSTRHGLEVAVTVDSAAAPWNGRVGLVTTLLPREPDPSRTLALVCGPEVMMRLAADALVDRGLSPDRIRVSAERNMKCGVGLCGHCQLREVFVCTDGPVLSYDRVGPLMRTREL
jgi:NAD(P)H-flavin reductase